MSDIYLLIAAANRCVALILSFVLALKCLGIRGSVFRACKTNELPGL